MSVRVDKTSIQRAEIVGRHLRIVDQVDAVADHVGRIRVILRGTCVLVVLNAVWLTALTYSYPPETLMPGDLDDIYGWNTFPYTVTVALCVRYGAPRRVRRDGLRLARSRPLEPPETVVRPASRNRAAMHPP